MSTRVTWWIDGYRRAWESNEPDEIRALFTDEAIYRNRPDDPSPAVGADAIVAHWLEEADPPGSTTFEWSVVAEQDDAVVVQCVTGYPSGPKQGIYDNLWVIRFAEDGRAREFTDWWLPRRDPAA